LTDIELDDINNYLKGMQELFSKDIELLNIETNVPDINSFLKESYRKELKLIDLLKDIFNYKKTPA
ncbi:hypothetical protein, partial [Clostridium chrysemydis]|uniref:hypothetical protein n=1 Tax=Clostridium chrysemydis TaxID=2665504 RepID=UPI003F3FE35B